MMKRLLFIMAAVALMPSTAALSASPQAEALAAIERTAAETGYTFEVRTALLEKAGEALAQGISPDAVGALVQMGAEQKVGGQSIVLFLSLVLETKRTGLPEGPVLNRILQGIAKGVPADKVLSAAGQVRGDLATAGRLVGALAQQGVSAGNAAERERAIKAVAVALEAGFADGDIEKLGGIAAAKKRGLPQFARAVESMTNLREAGMPPNFALQAARQFVILGYSEEGIARKELEIFSLRRNGWSWQDAYSRMSGGYDRGPRDMNGPSAQPGGTGGAGSGGMQRNRR